MSILIIRHGETPGNANRVVQMPDTPLSERGLEQAELLGRRLADSEVSRIIASDYARAAMTAQRVADATRVPIESEPLLRERHFGDHRGQRYDDLEVDLFGPDYAPPGGEDWQTFHQRVERAWQLIRDAAGETEGHLAIVTHGLVCFSLVEHHLQLPFGEEAVFGFGNTSLTVVSSAPPWHVELLNCTAHLDSDRATDDNAISGI